MKNSTIIAIAFLFAFATDSSAQSEMENKDANQQVIIEREISPEVKEAIIQRLTDARMQESRVKVTKKQFAPVKREAHDLKKIQAIPGKLD